MSDLISRKKALDAVNDCGICIQKILDIPESKERTAKVEWYPHLTKLADGHCECGEDVRDYWKYCPTCGCRLEWK